MVRRFTPTSTPSITQPHDNIAAERTMSQSNSDSDPESTDEREEEHEIKHFPSIKEETVSTIS
jgi:hypothetical protein